MDRLMHTDRVGAEAPSAAGSGSGSVMATMTDLPMSLVVTTPEGPDRPVPSGTDPLHRQSDATMPRGHHEHRCQPVSFPPGRPGGL